MVNGHSFILIRKMSALVRRALAELCTVPVLLVLKILSPLSTPAVHHSSDSTISWSTMQGSDVTSR